MGLASILGIRGVRDKPEDREMTFDVPVAMPGAVLLALNPNGELGGADGDADGEG